MRTLMRLLRDHRTRNADEHVTPALSPSVMSNDLATVQRIPWNFWNLCKQILEFRLQRPANLPVSIRCLYCWNLNSWYPDSCSNAHKTWVIRSLLKTEPVLLQETKWTQVQLQHLAHAWPDIRIAAALAKQDPNPQAGVAILVPPGWNICHQKILVDHYAVAACISFQACQIWIVSVYLPPHSQQTLASRILQAILALDEHPVFKTLLVVTLIAVISTTRKFGKTFSAKVDLSTSIRPFRHINTLTNKAIR